MKNRKLMSLFIAGVALSLTGCVGGDKEPTPPAPSAAPITLEIQETKRNTNEEIKKLVPSDDAKTNKALIIGDDILLVTYGTDNCINQPSSVRLTEGNTLLVEVPENKPLLACKGESEPQGWDVKVPDKRAKEIKSAQLTFPSGISGGISIYGENLAPAVPEEAMPKPSATSK